MSLNHFRLYILNSILSTGEIFVNSPHNIHMPQFGPGVKCRLYLMTVKGLHSAQVLFIQILLYG